MFPPETADWPIALWERDGQVVAWAWGGLQDDLRMQVDPACAELAKEALDWFDELAAGGPREFTLLDAETELCGRLLRRGYEERPDAPFFAYHECSPAELPEPVPPTGFTLRAVRGEEDLEQRVAVHQAAWNSTR